MINIIFTTQSSDSTVHWGLTFNIDLICVFSRSPDLYEEIPNLHNPSSWNDDFELMLQRSGPYGGRLQSDTLKDLEGTLALAHEMNSITRSGMLDQTLSVFEEAGSY